ncbi:MAG: cyclic nucleotide-binding/CBS domain-containing protein [Candidatus Methylomirabilales bacterium]
MVDPQEIEEEYPDEYLTVSEERMKPRITVNEAIFDRPIRDLHYHPPLCIQQTAKLAEAVELMKRHSVGAVMVQEGETLVGILSERDILRKVLGTDVDLDRATVEQYMTRNPEVLTLDNAVAYAIHTMHIGGFRHVPLVDKDHRPVGIVSVKDVNEYIVSFITQQILTLPPDPHREYEPRIDGG